jgi:tRNA-dihydrouridine synthase
VSEGNRAMSDVFARLRRGVVLAELGGHGDGPYCARHGAGCALVMMGTYIVDASDSVPYPPAFVFKPGREAYAGYLREHVAQARKSGAAVGVSAISVDLADTTDFLSAAEEAGADYVSVCLHSRMPMFVSRGLSSALLRRENWPRLREHVRAYLSGRERPLIAKIGLHDSRDVEPAIAEMTEAGVSAVHVNLGDAAGSSGLSAIPRLKRHVPFLIVGGGIKTAQDARRVIEAGADAVAVGSATMKDPGLCGRLQAALRGLQDSEATT